MTNDILVDESQRIRLADGTELAARIWLPQGTGPVPALLEYLPYRKRDATRVRDDAWHGWFARRGYACVRVDIRGTGDSDGIFTDEYVKQEQDDALEVIDWIARQPWCNGTLGMMGISWGGFNSLQIAARRPPALKAIVTSCSTDDRYADDIHYMGGCNLGDNFSWSSTMFGRLTSPPDPALVGPRWREMWLARLAHESHPLATWLAHQRRDEFWKHGSVCENFADIVCPVFALSGWADSYKNSVPRLLANLTVPRIGLIGAWSHSWGNRTGPGPLIGVLQEMQRWWDHWLKGRDTGIMREPMLRVFMQDYDPPQAGYKERSGRWVAEPVWPPRDATPKRLFLNEHARLGDSPDNGAPLPFISPQQTGLAGGEWCAHDTGTDLPTDQRGEDANSLTFDTPPLTEAVEILGAPVLELELSADKPIAMIAVRLNDVAPDGSSARVTYGVLNLTHRTSHEFPDALVPGQRYRVRVQMNDIAQRFPKGHRIRVALSTSYWPIIWPFPEKTEITIYAGLSHLELPVRAPRSIDAAVRFEPPDEAPMGAVTALEPPLRSQIARYDAARDETEIEITMNMGRSRLEEIDLETGAWRTEIWRVKSDDPLSAEGEIRFRFLHRRGDWQVETLTHSRLRATETDYLLDASLEAREGERSVFHRHFSHRIPRDFT